jgi:N-formylglutamate amidohydrolase
MEACGRIDNESGFLTSMHSLKLTGDPCMKHQKKLPIVLNIPHASSVIPNDIKDQLIISDQQLWDEIAQLTDWYANELYDIPGATPIIAPVSRLVVDTERYSVDANEPMAQLGMGAIYTKGAGGFPIRAQLNETQREALLSRFYYPHHQSLEDAIQQCLTNHESCVVIDCHTFPKTPFAYESHTDALRPDICIGLHETNTPLRLVSQLKRQFTNCGLSVAVNTPYTGCVLPKKFNNNTQVIAVMIEINRKLYIEEPHDNKLISVGNKPSKKESFWKIKKALKSAITNVTADFVRSSLISCTVEFNTTKQEAMISINQVNYILDKFTSNNVRATWIPNKYSSGDETEFSNLKLKINDYGSQYTFFKFIQTLRKDLKIEAIRVTSSNGICLRITEDTLICNGYTAILRKSTLKEAEGETFNPRSESMYEFKDFYYFTTDGTAFDGFVSRHFTYMKQRLASKLLSYDLFTFTPSDGAGRFSHPDWIAAIAPLSEELTLIWQHNPIIEKNGAYILMLETSRRWQKRHHITK